MTRNPAPGRFRLSRSCCSDFFARGSWFLCATLLFIFVILPHRNVSAQGDPGPQPTNPPQLAVFGSALSHLKTPWLKDRLSRSQGIIGWQFFHAAANGQSDIYLGSVQVSPSPLPPLLSASPGAPSNSGSDHIRYVYLHDNRFIPPSPNTDVIFAAPIPYRIPPRSMPLLIDSNIQLDLLIQICEWHQPGQTPPPLLEFRTWLDQPQTGITQIRARASGLRTVIEICAEELLANGTVLTTLWQVSAQKDSSGNFIDLEVTP